MLWVLNGDDYVIDDEALRCPNQRWWNFWKHGVYTLNALKQPGKETV